jgi:polysaccharide export outer membrane protein
LLLDTLSSSGSTAGDQEAGIRYSITRSQEGQKVTIPAIESTILMPGDVMKVISPLARLQGGQVSPEASSSETTMPGEASQ